MVTKIGLSGRGCSGAVLAGRFTPMSTVASGAATMKMMSSTRITSMNGVTLISCWMSRSSPLERCPSRTPMAAPRCALQGAYMDALSATDHQEKLRRGVIQDGAIAADDADEVIVDHDCGDCCDEPHRGRKQRFGNAGRYNREIGGVGFG